MERIFRIIESLDFGNTTNEVFSFEQVANAFKQGRVKLPLVRKMGGGGNCASIALIKGAIGNFGYSGIFRSVIIDKQRNRFLIDLVDDDDTVFKLSFKNFSFAKEKSSFVLHNEDEISKDIFEFAMFCYAVIAEVKRRTYRRFKRYKRAITDLNKGESTRYIFEYLGLERDIIEDVSIENLSRFKHLVVWNKVHAVYSSEGHYDEFFKNHSDIESLEQLKSIHGKGSDKYNPKGAYMLKVLV